MAKAKAETAPISVSGPTHILKPSQWKEMPLLQVQLQKLLDDPIYKMACMSLLTTAMPNARIELIPGVSAEQMALVDSQKFHHRSGFAQFHRAIHNLALPKGAVGKDAKFGSELLEEDE